jgi:prepilin-type N-terminal cleavage/methylation domain-containing protein/prepilin-type processing-associated H-X9-DG protein
MKVVRKGFTLVELLVVIGIIALLISILLPSLNKARSAAKAATCLSNCRQMGTAWTMYLSDSKGGLPYYIWQVSNTGQIAASVTDQATREQICWSGYWYGILSSYKVQTSTMLCPEAQEPIAFNNNGSKGFGTAKYAWSGAQQSSAVGIRLNGSGMNPTNDALKKGYRIGSYGFNRWLTRGSKFGDNIARARHSTETPVFYDSCWVDNTSMTNGDPNNQPTPPADLTGNAAAGAGSGNDQFRVLLNRHNRGINVAYADGHAGYVAAPDVYNLEWHPTWTKYTLTNLPQK